MSDLQQQLDFIRTVDADLFIGQKNLDAQVITGGTRYSVFHTLTDAEKPAPGQIKDLLKTPGSGLFDRFFRGEFASRNLQLKIIDTSYGTGKAEYTGDIPVGNRGAAAGKAFADFVTMFDL